jgi:hypothetical protein
MGWGETPSSPRSTSFQLYGYPTASSAGLKQAHDNLKEWPLEEQLLLQCRNISTMPTNRQSNYL